jgi:hypothetical protein
MNLEKLIVTAFLFVVCAPVRFCLAQTPDRVFIVGGGTSAPVVLYKVDPEYTEEAFKAGYSGTVVRAARQGWTRWRRCVAIEERSLSRVDPLRMVNVVGAITRSGAFAR